LQLPAWGSITSVTSASGHFDCRQPGDSQAHPGVPDHFRHCLRGWLVFGELAGLYTPAPLERSVPGDFVTVTVLLIATAFMVRLLTESLFQSSLEVQKELNERKRAEEAPGLRRPA